MQSSLYSQEGESQTALNGAISDVSNAGFARTCAVVELNQETKALAA